MKKQFFAIAAAALVLAAGCSKETGGNDPIDKGTRSGVAYLSVQVEAQKTTRASGEEAGLPAENVLDSIYVITFNASNNVVAAPGELNYALIEASSTANPYNPMTAIKVSAASTNLVVVANPGAELKARIESLGSTYNALNAAIQGIDIKEMQDFSGDFTMISGGADTLANGTHLAPNDLILQAYVPIGDKIQVAVDETPEAAQTAMDNALAPANRLQVKLERLASKLSVKVREAAEGGVTMTGSAVGAAFALTDWTVDALNTTYYPYAEKTVLGVEHTSTLGSYVSSFYTKDPNFTDRTGIVYNTVNPDYTMNFQWNGYYGWQANAAAPVYAVENTMAASSQKTGFSTRVVLKATYKPAGFVDASNDWFAFDGENFDGLDALQAKYALVATPQNFKDACDDFYDSIKAYGNAAVTAEDFTALVQADLDLVPAGLGGQVVKNGVNPVIRWYDDGVCYYYWEIRHDNSTQATNATSPFAKYGVVRNNQYNLTLTSVKGPGTPWYPEIDKPGPGDPKPGEDIDTGTGYVGITVTVAPWIVWETNMSI